MRRTTWILLLVLAGLIPVAIFGRTLLDTPVAGPFRNSETPAAAPQGPYLSPESRTEGIARVLDVEPPERLPMIGQEEPGPFGYPLETPDRVALASLLRAERFDALEAHLDELQDAFEGDHRKEYWPIIALDAFVAGDLADELDAWVSHSPDSWAALAARGNHRVAEGFRRRGGARAADTPAANFEQMRTLHQAARGDLDAALERRPELLAAHVARVRLGKSLGAAGADRAYAEALALCPECESARMARFRQLAPKWGGTVGQQEALVAEALSHRDANARLGAFAGMMSWQRCSEARIADEMSDALEACNEAIDRGGRHWLFLMERGAVRAEAGDARLARADLEAARPLRPMNDRLLRLLEWCLFDQVELDAALDLYETLLRLDPRDSMTLARYDSRVHGLLVAARGADDPARVEALRQRAWRLAPGDYRVLQTLFRGVPMTELEAWCRRDLAAWPESFAAHRCLDYALAHQSRLPEIVALWDDYLERHPEDGYAYWERSGTHHLLQHREASLADMRRACELGVVAACEREASETTP